MPKFYAKVETSIKRSVKIQQLNSYPKGKDGQPKNAQCFDDIHLGTRVENTYQDNRMTEVTFKADTQLSGGRHGNERCTKEDWKNQWSKWIGETLRQKLNKINNTVGNGFSQSNNVYVSKNNQSENNRVRGPQGHRDGLRDPELHGSSVLTEMALENNTEKSFLHPELNDFKMGEGNLAHKKNLRAKYYDPYSQQSKTYFDKEPKEKATTLLVDKVAYNSPLKSSLKRTSSLTRAEAIETARSCRLKRTTNWLNPEGNLIHNTQSDTEEVRKKERVTLPIEANLHNGNKRSRRKQRSTHKTKGESLSHLDVVDGKANNRDGYSTDKVSDFNSCEGNREGRDKPISNDNTVDRWCNELAGVWTANARRDNLEEDTKFGSYTNLNDKEPRIAKEDRSHKARIVAMTMLVEGRDEPKATSIAQTPNKTDLHFKGKTIDEILSHLEDIKNDPSIPMPCIEADKANLDEFMKYLDGHPNAVSIKNNIMTIESEEEQDRACLLHLSKVCTDNAHELRPSVFPIGLWKYVMDDQKPLVNNRWQGYDPKKISEKITKLLTELKISKERPYAVPYFEAQALANMDRFEVKESDGTTPLIHERFTHRVELLPGARPKREKPQKFSEMQNAFLRAKLSVLEKEGKLKQRNGLQDGDWLHRLVLPEYPTRIEEFRLKYGSKTQEALNDPANEYEVSQLYRLTVDCRELNNVTVIEPFPMPDNNMGKENIIGSRYMNVSDAADAFFAVPIREEDQGKTGFTALGSQWVFTVMLQGGVNSPGHFSRIITETFEGIPHSKVCPFQDDALCHAKNLSISLENQQLMYDRIRMNSIMLKATKTKLGFSTCKFLGHIYTPWGRLPDPSKVEAILKINERPVTPTEVRHIVGLIIWNIEYLPNGMSLLSHLTDLVKKDADIINLWSDDVHGKVMEQLKAGLISAPCLKPIDVTRPFRVHVDACKNGRGIGAVLLQEYDGKWRPCSYFSRALKTAQRQWSATELEAYGLVSAAKHWERYLQNGHMWTAIVDHKALIYLVVKRTKTNNTRLLNSVMNLQGHHFAIEHRNGDEHFDADAVSRILHSGDILEARAAEEIETEESRLVTMKDIHNLTHMLKLQLTQLNVVQEMNKKIELEKAKLKSNPICPDFPHCSHSPDYEEVTASEIAQEIENAAQSLLNISNTTIEPQPKRLIGQVNMATIFPRPRNRAEREEGREAVKEAMRLADEQKRKMAREKRFQHKQEVLIRQQVNIQGVPTPTIPIIPPVQALPNMDDSPPANMDDQVELEEEKDNVEQESPDDEGNNDVEPLRLLNVGPYRWTSGLINEYIIRFKSLEGRYYAHPRTRRIYEITNVFFHPHLKIGAAYSRVMDGGQPDIHDQYPSRIQGKGGLAELVQKFEASGGSQGHSKTQWPNTIEEWGIEQEKDQEWEPLISKWKEVVHGLRDKAEAEGKNVLSNDIKISERIGNFDLEYSNLLYIHTERDGIKRRLIIVPEQLKRNVLELYHDSKGHPGISRCKDTITLKYWWRNITKDVDNYVRSCKACARRKSKGSQAAVPIQSYEGPTTPWARTHMDLTGPVTTSTKGNKYILVVKDALTRFVETVPLKSNTAEDVAEALIREVICRHGAFGRLISDNGREFDNKLMAQISQLLQIKHTTICPENPRANGLAENHMRVLKDSLSIYTQETLQDWDEYLSGVTMAYNTTVNSQTGHTPFYMMYGREARLPNEIWMTDYSESGDVNKYIQNMITSLNWVWEKASNNKPKEIKRMQDSQKPRRHLQFAEYKVGDYAMVSRVSKPTIISWLDKKEKSISAKLQPRFSGPYLITGQRSPVVYVLQIDGRDKSIHAVNMKPFSGKQTYTTPFVQTGFSKSEADEEIVEEPLLLSPNPDINEAARVNYRQKNPTPQREASRRSNMENIKEQRESFISQRQEESSLNDDWILDQYEYVQDDEDIRQSRAWLKEKELRRTFLLAAQREAFQKKTEREQEHQRDMENEHGLTAEDMIDIELNGQEESWRQSLSDSLREDELYREDYNDSENDDDDVDEDINRAIARRS